MKTDKLEIKQRKNTIARRIKETRIQKRLNQHDLAVQIGCVQSNIHHFEAGTTEPSLSVVIQLCDALGCSVDYLLGRDACYNTTTLKGRLLKAFESLTNEVQTTVVLMIEGITGQI